MAASELSLSDREPDRCCAQARDAQETLAGRFIIFASLGKWSLDPALDPDDRRKANQKGA
jgi:hypothetical protein